MSNYKYVQIDDNKNIIAAANWKFPNSQLAPEEVVEDSHGNLYFKSKLPPMNLEELKEEKIKQIDKETSESILAGFRYTIKDKERFFSYDSFDQQNFVDTASGAILSQLQQSSLSGIPANVDWNSYIGDEKTLDVITLNATEFLDLYINGVLVHKNTKMAIGKERKLKVEAAQSKEELDAI